MAKDVVERSEVAYGGWDHCERISNGEVELVVTKEVGPRVIRFGFVGGKNMFQEYQEMMGKTGGDEWRIYGGHRLWHAPEDPKRTYWPDNGPIETSWDGQVLRTIQPVEKATGIVKEMEITLNATENKVTVLHRLTNTNLWEVELAVWSLSVMAQNGRMICPQEPFRSHSESLLPARPMVLWPYTDMADPRWTWGTKYIQLQQDPNGEKPQKIGVWNSAGWAAYVLGEDVFIKCIEVKEGDARRYPDFGCNFEFFTYPQMLEVESLGPLVKLGTGQKVEHIETWFLHKQEIGDDEAEIDKQLLPLVCGFALFL